MGEQVLGGLCPHCGMKEQRRLGTCTVCHRTVCENCGNMQIVNGERRITHTECLRRDDGAFKMIKFVR